MARVLLRAAQSLLVSVVATPVAAFLARLLADLVVDDCAGQPCYDGIALVFPTLSLATLAGGVYFGVMTLRDLTRMPDPQGGVAASVTARRLARVGALPLLLQAPAVLLSPASGRATAGSIALAVVALAVWGTSPDDPLFSWSCLLAGVCAIGEGVVQVLGGPLLFTVAVLLFTAAAASRLGRHRARQADAIPA